MTTQPPQNAMPQEPPSDFYTDGMFIGVAYAGLTFVFQQSQPPTGNMVPVGIARMSPQQAFVLMQMLRKTLRAYEDNFGALNVPDGLLQTLDISREY